MQGFENSFLILTHILCPIYFAVVERANFVGYIIYKKYEFTNTYSHDQLYSLIYRANFLSSGKCSTVIFVGLRATIASFSI